MQGIQFESSLWYQYMDEPMRALAKESFRLLEFLEYKEDAEFVDYGFVVFPIAKAYEGFLKKVFFELKLINKQQFSGEHFRIGRALNPNLPKRYRSDWVYDKLVNWCQGESLPLMLWNTWKKGRNRVFHFFPSASEQLGYSEARQIVSEIAEAMNQTMVGCSLS